jgi:hypothetical protein
MHFEGNRPPVYSRRAIPFLAYRHRFLPIRFNFALSRFRCRLYVAGFFHLVDEASFMQIGQRHSLPFRGGRRTAYASSRCCQQKYDSHFYFGSAAIKISPLCHGPYGLACLRHGFDFVSVAFCCSLSHAACRTFFSPIPLAALLLFSMDMASENCWGTYKGDTKYIVSPFFWNIHAFRR